MLEIEVISACLGMVIGLILALTGAGGATLTIPMLVLVFNLSIFQAAPIALLAVFTAASIGTMQGLRKGVVRYKSALLIAIIGMALAPLGVKLAQNTPNQLLSIGLIFTLLFISLRSWQLANQHAADNSHLPPPACMINPANSKLFWTAACTKRLIGTGIISGFLSGLLGVGGGFVIAPSLHKVSNFNPATVVATTLAAVALISASSIVSHWQTSAINWQIAIPFVIGVNFAMLLTTEILSEKISKQTSQKGFAVVCAIAAMYLVFKNMA